MKLFDKYFFAANLIDIHTYRRVYTDFFLSFFFHIKVLPLLKIMILIMWREIVLVDLKFIKFILIYM